MQWIKLNSRRIRHARYDEQRQQLDIKLANGSLVRHQRVLTHMYENLVGTTDPDFYYIYYIEPCAVPSAGHSVPKAGKIFKIACFLTATWLLSASAVASHRAGADAGSPTLEDGQHRVD